VVLGFLLYTRNSSVNTSVIEGESSFLGLFSLGALGVVISEIDTERDSCGSVSTRVFTSHYVWFTYFSISGLRVWA
jgi:hypothetical protein